MLVTEPTVSGLHDLKRVCELVKKFNIKSVCIINKANAHYVTEVEKNARLDVQNEFVVFVDVLNALAVLEVPDKYAQLKLNPYPKPHIPHPIPQNT